MKKNKEKIDILPYRIRSIASFLEYYGYEIVPKRDIKEKIKLLNFRKNLLIDELLDYLDWIKKRKTKKEKLKYFCELNSDISILEDYIKLLQKYYLKDETKRTYHNKDTILNYYQEMKKIFSTKKKAILATANHFDITPKAVEKHIYKK